jgi:hypothetical protein
MTEEKEVTSGTSVAPPRGPTREQVAEVQRIILDGADGDMRAEWPLLAAQLYDVLVP